LGCSRTFTAPRNPGELAEQLRQATLKYYGTPIRHFLELLVQCYGSDLQRLVDRLKQSRDDFLGRLLPGPVSGQVRSGLQPLCTDRRWRRAR
jgi:hypothetical protein